MTDWHVTITGTADSTVPTVDQLEALADALADYGGVATGANGQPAGASFAVNGADLRKATMIAEEIWRRATAAAELFADIGELHLVEWDTFERDLDAPNFPNLLGVTELAERLGVTRQRAHQLAQRNDFPEPVARLSSGPVWTEPSIQLFVDTWERKPGRPPTATQEIAGALDLTAASLIAAIAILVIAGIMDRKTSKNRVTLALADKPLPAPTPEADNVISITRALAARTHRNTLDVAEIARAYGINEKPDHLASQLDDALRHATS